MSITEVLLGCFRSSVVGTGPKKEKLMNPVHQSVLCTWLHSCRQLNRVPYWRLSITVTVSTQASELSWRAMGGGGLGEATTIVGLQIPKISTQSSICWMPIHEASTSKLSKHQGFTASSWGQILQHSFTDLVEFLSCQVWAVVVQTWWERPNTILCR